MNIEEYHLDCCIIHGCKYHDKKCPVANGQITQRDICSNCIDDIMPNVNPGIEEQDRLILNQENKILRRIRSFKLKHINKL